MYAAGDDVVNVMSTLFDAAWLKTTTLVFNFE
jgi:hypothetical protein